MGFFSSLVGAVAGPLVGGLLGSKSSKDAGDANAALQREFAQNGIQWKVEDAKKAGVHPLYALGAPTISASPSYVADTALPNAFSEMGQNVTRAIEASMTRDDRVKSAAIESLQLERAGLENELLRSQISQVNRASNPAFPGGSQPIIAGQGDAYPTAAEGPVALTPNEIVSADPSNPAKEAGAVTDYGFARTPTGLAVVPSKDVKQRIEDTIIPEMMWSWRNTLRPDVLIGGHTPPDPKLYPPPPGHHWKWSSFAQEFRPVRNRSESLRHSYRGGAVR